MGDLPFANKKLGQHWLTDRSILEAICDAGEVQPEDTVLEIGPGSGTLTELLVKQAREVVAVEFDAKLAAALPGNLGASNLKVVQQDILSFDLTTLPPDYKVVANIPYYLTSNLIRTLSETTNRAERVVILIQKEVAERVAAQPGDMSLLSVSAQFYWEVSLGLEVPARAFTPPPKVDSELVILKRRVQPLFPGIDVEAFFRLVKAGFAARRKTLLNSLSGGLRADKAAIATVLAETYIQPSTRAQRLSLEQWHVLYMVCRAQNLV
ncbi:MAG TPA: 16S rRNA (adenine(1518)-N(6)/adenine(1519)-N(6))-dimethyltransferase RsmA [Patescibacteria group bacterium]|nr:16S rRNA (adenine(1518)-N(6)/adenine(1519)-N(6))-dimethyltransferase RsmA [Patescibacteria group bacterium]